MSAAPLTALQGREEEECALRAQEEAGHCHLLSMAGESMACTAQGAGAWLWAEPAHLSSTGQGLAAGSGHRVSLQSKTKAGLCGP